MGHYECKKCGQYYDDCDCGKPAVTLPDAKVGAVFLADKSLYIGRPDFTGTPGWLVLRPALPDDRGTPALYFPSTAVHRVELPASAEILALATDAAQNRVNRAA